MPTTLSQLSPRTILTGTFLVFLGPFLLVELFPAQLDIVIDKSAYVVFHNTAEFFSIMVSLSVFSIGWFTHDQSQDRHALFLGTAFLAIGLLDFMHTMSNVAMPAFLTPNSTNKSTQFWIVARLLDASALLASSYIYAASPSRWLSKKFLLTMVLLGTGLVFTGIVFFPSYLPATAIQGVGLTPLKRYLEFLVILLLAVAIVRYWRRMMRTADRSLIYYPAAFIICIFSEGVFASYKTGFDTYNILGHIYKVAAFYLIYRGVFIAAVKVPYERLKDEQKLKHLASFPQLNPNPIIEITSSGGISFLNPAARRLLDDLGLASDDFSVFLGEDFDAVLQDLRTKNETTIRREITIRDRVFRENIFLTPQFDTVRIYVSDITKRKDAENALRKSEKRYHSLFDNMLEGFAYCKMLYDDQGRPADFVYLEVNNAFGRLTGLENVIGRKVTEVVPGIKESSRELFEIYGRVATTGNHERFEIDFKPLAKFYSISVYSMERDHFVAVFDDISERKRVEAALMGAKRTLERERDILQEVMNGAKNFHLAYLDRDFNFVHVNETFARSRGYRPEQMIGKNHFAVHPYAEHEAIFTRVRDTGELAIFHDKPFEYPDQPERGVTYWDWLLSPVKDQGKEVVGLVFSLFETTERKKTEEILRLLSSELEKARLRAETDRCFLESVMEALPTGVAIIDARGGLIRCNRAFERVWGGQAPVSQSVDDYAVYKAWWADTGALVAPEEWAASLALQTGETVSGQVVRIQRFDGTEAFAINSASPIFDVQGKIIGSAVAIQDISRLKQVEDKLKTSLREKEVLLKEIHHRVKNNMQVVYSLLNLQAKGIVDKTVRAMFEESRNRVMSMSLIHENLYQSKDLAFIDFKVYLHGLIASIENTYMRREVDLTVDMEPITLDVNAGIPCGLIVNELVSNSLKYAFPEGRRGRIKVSLCRNGAGDYELSVTDNGIGLPAKMDIRNAPTLGLQLVFMLTRQLHGVVALPEVEEGARFMITFPERPKVKGDSNE